MLWKQTDARRSAKDGQPVLLRDGDLIIFGTQRHGVPKMCGEGAI